MAYDIRNNKGMAATATALAITVNDKVGFLAVAGAQTAVKAIWASVINNRTPLYAQGPELSYGKKIKGDDNIEYVVDKHTLCPGLHHWVIQPECLPNAAFYPMLPIGEMKPEEVLVHVLQRHTLWPVRDYDEDPEWGKLLFEKGSEEGLVAPMDTYGKLEWAYQVFPVGWDDIIDELAASGELTFPKKGVIVDGDAAADAVNRQEKEAAVVA